MDWVWFLWVSPVIVIALLFCTGVTLLLQRGYQRAWSLLPLAVAGTAASVFISCLGMPGLFAAGLGSVAGFVALVLVWIGIAAKPQDGVDSPSNTT